MALSEYTGNDTYRKLAEGSVRQIISLVRCKIFLTLLARLIQPTSLIPCQVRMNNRLMKTTR